MRNTIAGVSLLIASVICTVIFTIGVWGHATGPELVEYGSAMENPQSLFVWSIVLAATGSFLASLFFFFLAAITGR